MYVSVDHLKGTLRVFSTQSKLIRQILYILYKSTSSIWQASQTYEKISNVYRIYESSKSVAIEWFAYLFSLYFKKSRFFKNVFSFLNRIIHKFKGWHVWSHDFAKELRIVQKPVLINLPMILYKKKDWYMDMGHMNQ